MAIESVFSSVGSFFTSILNRDINKYYQIMNSSVDKLCLSICYPPCELLM